VGEEGFADVPGGRVWYTRLGAGDATPLLVLHGGPGCGHDYLAALGEALAADRPVVLYDQLGCGRSEQPDDESLWTIDRFADEVDAVRAALGLERIHLLGQSWGGWLALEYMTRGTTGVERLVLASTSASIGESERAGLLLLDQMPEPQRTVLIAGDESGDHDTPEHEAALGEYYRRHGCRLDPWPPALLASVANMDGNAAGLTMFGPAEFVVTGPLASWDRTADLGRVDVPTLITVGRYDQIPLACAETLHAGIPGSHLVVFEQSGHVAHLEEPEAYVAAVRDFLG
jgi:proline-specific peptidase